MSAEIVDMFHFMAIRAGERLEAKDSNAKFIRDADYFLERSSLEVGRSVLEAEPHDVGKISGINPVDLFSPLSASEIGRLVFSLVLHKSAKKKAGNKKKNTGSKNDNKSIIIDSVEEMLASGFSYGIHGNSHRFAPVLRTVDLKKVTRALDGFNLGAVSATASYLRGETVYILPEQLSDLHTPLTAELAASLRVVREFAKGRATRQVGKPAFRIDALMQKLAARLGLPESATAMTEFVFSVPDGSYTPDFALTKRVLFDTLYGLYILRKRHKVSLEPVIDGLRMCHLLEMLAINQYLHAAISAGNQARFHQDTQKLRNVLEAVYPLLSDWKSDVDTSKVDLLSTGVPLINSDSELEGILLATPVVHPIFAQLTNTFEPFNAIVPIGIGELKVVRQQFLGYRKGEIAHIETVLAGETKTRVHRALEKAEDSFSLSSSEDKEATKDSQSTSRFEMKQESEETIKNDLGLNANASFTYKGNPVVDASVTAGMTYANSKSNSDKSSRNFVNEVIDKATSRVQSKVSQQRSQTRQTETEETNTHSFVNPAANGNISGIYRWLEKVYQGQIHNYGKRLMFEFLVPEPAEFFVESRLYSYAASLSLPPKPSNDSAATGTRPALPVAGWADIDEEEYNELGGKFDLTNFPYPPELLERPIAQVGTGNRNFEIQVKFGVIGEPPAKTETFSGSIPEFVAGYSLAQVGVSGSAKFTEQGEIHGLQEHQNTLAVSINNREIFRRIDETKKVWADGDFQFAQNYSEITPDSMFLANPFSIQIFSKTCEGHSLSFTVKLKRSSATYQKWQQDVFNEISRKVTGTSGSTASQDYESRLIAYNKAMAEIKATAWNEIIQGRSASANEEIVKRELKRQCISMIAREFDSQAEDDVASKLNARGTFNPGEDVYFPQLMLHEESGAGTRQKKPGYARFEDKDDPVFLYSAPDLEVAREKGRYIQFLEQAFEWSHQSHILYPYFWATPPKWIELMNREDAADPMFSEFLQAGSAKVLLAVKPGYEDAVLHFLATREPWEGGPSPVIGDPLFIPLYEEIRNRQDDLAGSSPVGDSWIFTLPTSLVYLEVKDGSPPLIMEYPMPAVP